MFRSIKRLAAVGLLSLVAITGAGAVPQAAQASVCTTPYCGGVVYNGSSVFPIRITNCWSDSYGTRLYANDPPCASSHLNNANSYNADWELPMRDGSQYHYYYYDVDAFRVYAGCRVQWSETGLSVVIDRHGLGSVWVKISNGESITITNITC